MLVVVCNMCLLLCVGMGVGVVCVQMLDGVLAASGCCDVGLLELPVKRMVSRCVFSRLLETLVMRVCLPA